METEVRIHRGWATLFVDGRARTGLTLFFGRARDAGQDIRRFAEAGIDMFSGCMGVGGARRGDGSLDFAAIDELFAAVLAANPDALILPRVGVGWWHPPPGREAEHAAEAQVDIDAVTGERHPAGYSFSSAVWRRDAAADLRAYIRHCESRYGEHVVGYHIGAGAAGEWAYSWQPKFSDYGQAQQAAFRDWLRERYGGDVAALRAAWNDSGAAFGTAVVPPPRRRLRGPGETSLLDPARDRDVIDYLTFHSQTVASALVHFCGAAKAALRELGLTKVVGAFYGYHFKNLNKPANFHNAGHFAQQAVLDCDDIDFLCAPYCYQAREHGDMYLAQLIAGSVRLRGKLYFCEDDTFTFRSRREPGRSWCPDRAATVGVLRRNLAGVLRDGGTLWWMDCGGNGPLRPGGQVDGWYHDDALMDNFAAMRRLAAERLTRGDHAPSAQVAVVLSETSAVYHRHDAALMDALIMRQMYDLGQLGAPFDTFRAGDLWLLAGRPWAANYRLLIFPDALHLSDAERAALRAGWQTGGRTILWTYGAGIITDEGLRPEAMADVTGFRVALRWRDEPLIVSTFAAGARLLYGTERPISPVIYGADEEAETAGWLVNEADPALLLRQFDGWRSVWSAAPAVPAALLRQFARAAGVHLYVETGEQVIADGDLLTLHAGFTGRRVVRLPAPCDVTDAYTGAQVAAGASEFAADLDRGATATWRLRRRGRGSKPRSGTVAGA